MVNAMKKVILLFFSLLVLTAGGVVFFYYYNLQPAGNGDEVIFVVNKGESTKSIGQRLQKQGLIKNYYAFLAYLQLTGQVGKLQAGSFRLSPQSSVPDLTEELRKGRIDVWVTFIEGQRREEYAEIINQELNLPVDEFLDLTKNKEGRLFPDSYLFPTDVVVPQVIKKMDDNFKSKWEKLDNQTNFSQDEILVLASLVEREVKTDEDREIVAGILVKRLENDWPLQVDASVQYAKGGADNWWPKVSGADLRTIDSPYNTYMYKGLPPTPICNPSLESIKAVIGYRPTDYWYYLSDHQGKVYYARTLDEQNVNIGKYLN